MRIRSGTARFGFRMDNFANPGIIRIDPDHIDRFGTRLAATEARHDP